MKILIIATEDYYGAGKAAHRIYQALSRSNNEVCFLVKFKKNNTDPGIISYSEKVKQTKIQKFKERIYRLIEDKFFRKPLTEPHYYFLGANPADNKLNLDKLIKKLPFIPEMILITWISGFFDSKAIYKLGKLTNARIIAFPMDMSLFTGGCHYAWDCNGYVKDCNNCPAFTESQKAILAKQKLIEKKFYYDKSGINAIAASTELYKQLNQSILFKDKKPISKILIPVDENIFNTMKRSYAKQLIGIEESRKVIFFGASFTSEKRKGVNFFMQALKELHEKFCPNKINASEILVVLAGQQTNHDEIKRKIPFELHFTGYINSDEKLSLLYQAADVFVCSSIQDSGPMMINEAIMCGTPVVSFNVGVAEDLVQEDQTGYKVTIGDSSEMATRIMQVLSNEKWRKISEKIAAFGYAKSSYKTFSQTMNNYEFKRN